MSLAHQPSDPRQQGAAIGCITSNPPTVVPTGSVAGGRRASTAIHEPHEPTPFAPSRAAAGTGRVGPDADADFDASAIDFGILPALHELVARQVERTPEALAVVAEDGMLTFGGLARRARIVAGRLRRLGIGPGSIVGIGVERSRDMIVGMLAVLEAGAAYLPLDPAAAAERLAFMIDDARASLVLTHARFAAVWPARVRTLPLERLDDRDGAEDPATCPPDAESTVKVGGDSLAYVIYTSGSTGRPKGVGIHHAAVTNFMFAMQHRHPLQPTDVVLQSTPPTFDISIYEIFAPLIRGARLVIAPPGRPDPRPFALFMEDHGITVAQFVPSMLGMLLDDQAFERRRGLRRVVCGGEPLTRGLVRRFHERSDAELVNGYGPTEATIYATTWTSDQAADDRAPPIGRPLPNTRCHVLDERLRPLPVGVTGELFIGGLQVAAGYLDRPDLTAQRFIADPGSRDPLARLYRTGDLARWRADGTIEFHGRIDHQVKIRGHRIEPGEIEAVLECHPDIAHAAVVARDDHRNADTIGKVLRGCVVPRTGRAADIPSLRRHVSERLPEAMVPEEWLVLAALPLLSNGKVDRRTLVESPLAEARVSPAGHGRADAPRSPLEHELARIWMRLFDRERVGRTENFFDLGGHSLLAARLVAELERLIGQRIPIAWLFRAPTIESLARMLTDSTWLPAWSSLTPLQPRGPRTPLFLTHGWGGEVYGLLDLARALAPDQPVYGLQAVGLDGAEPRHASVEEMAAHYVREIRELRPTGPYRIGGHSLGGWIAYEIAQQLRAQSQEATVLLFDTYPHCRTPWPASGIAALIHGGFNGAWAADRTCHHLRRIFSLEGRDLLPYLRQRSATLARVMSGSPPTPRSSRPAAVARGREAGPVRRPPDYYQLTVARYAARPFDGHVHLFQASRPRVALLPAFWRRLATGGLTVHRVPFGHNDMLRAEHAPAMAARLAAALVAMPARG